MSLRDVINTMAIAAAMIPPSTGVAKGTRRFREHDHFTPSQWEKRKKRQQMQKASRKINRNK